MKTQADKEHWILRITPQSQRQRVIRIGFIVGALCYGVLLFNGVIGLLFGPLVFAALKPSAPISQPVIWLKRISGSDAFAITYTFLMCAIIYVILTGYTFFESVRNKRNIQ